jgi:hypothetical protein
MAVTEIAIVTGTRTQKGQWRRRTRAATLTL